MTRRDGPVRVQGPGELAKRLSRLGNAIPAAMQAVMDDTAEKAVVGLLHPLDDAADGGLTPWMSVKPGRASSSVRPSRRRRTAQQGVAEAQVIRR